MTTIGEGLEREAVTGAATLRLLMIAGVGFAGLLDLTSVMIQIADQADSTLADMRRHQPADDPRRQWPL